MDFSLTEAQQELAGLTRQITGRRATAGRLAEVEAGGDRFDPELWADLAGAGVLAARVPGAERAAVLLGPAATPDGVAVFLVAPDDAGVSVTRQRLTDGDVAGRVELSGVALGDDRVLGGPDAPVAGWLSAHATAGLCAHQLGVVERALELTAQYAGRRVQFGRPIGSFQAVAQRLADGYIDVEAVRLPMWQAGWPPGARPGTPAPPAH